MTSILAIITVIAIVVAFIAYKLWSAKKEVERVLKVNASLEQKSQQQAAEISAKNTQLNNHNTRIKNEEDAHSAVREQLIDELHNDGDLRD
ncbi:DUF2681 domain-containing protein [Ursidibacter sp. B-7004-1]